MERFKPCCFLPFVPLLKAGVPGDSDRVNGSAQSAQSLLLERSWHRSQGKGGPNEGPPQTYPRPNLLSPPARRDSPRPRRLGLRKRERWDLVPLKPTPDLIFFRLRLVGIHPVLDDSDGVGFETMCYYLIINTIKDLYCAVLREIATTCNYAVTNCHGIHLPHY